MPELQPAQFAVVSRVPPLTMLGRTPAPQVHSTHANLDDAHLAYEVARAGTETNRNGVGSDVRWSVEPYPLEQEPLSIYRQAQRARRA